jgi:hypothetical protein
LRAGWTSLSTCRQRYTCPSTHRPACCTTSSTTSASTMMLKSYKDLSWGKGQSTRYGQSLSSRFIPIFSSYLLQVSSSVVITSCMYASLTLVLVLLVFFKKVLESNKNTHMTWFDYTYSYFLRLVTNTRA